MTSLLKMLVLLIPFTVCLLLSASCDTVHLSSLENQALHSPSGIYEALLEEVAERSGLSRQLVVQRSGTHSVVVTIPINRHAEIAWSPDESAVAILDYFASNENRILIFLLPSGNQIKEVGRDNTFISIGTNGASAKEYSHVYFSRPKWITSRKMRATVAMYDRLSLVPPEEYKGVYEFPVAQ
jgi:hypothetical protein